MVRVVGTKYKSTLQFAREEPIDPTKPVDPEDPIEASMAGVAPTTFDFTYQGNTSERIKCDMGECIPEENYGSFLTGSFQGATTTSLQYRQGQTGNRYIYNSNEYFYTNPSTSNPIHQIGWWWAQYIYFPDGESLTFTYDTADGSTPYYSRHPHRPNTVSSNTGYDIRFTYVSDVWTDSSVEWYQLKTAAIYKSSTATLLAKFTYAISGAETTVTDLAGRQWKYSGYQNTPSVLPVTAVTSNFTLKLPTNTFNSVSTTRYASGPSQALVNTVSRNGLTYTYTYSGVSSLGGTNKIFTGLTITGPLGYQRILTYGAWGQGYAKQPYVISDTNSQGKKTSYTYEFRRIKTVTFPEGNKVTYTYDDKGNVLQKRATKKTGASNPDIVNSATYPDSCPYGARCFKPATITDGNNKITTYTFADHGGLLEAVGPAASNGYKRVTRNVWLQASGSGLWRLDNSKECFLDECNTLSTNVRITSYTYWGATNLPLTVTTRSSASSLDSSVVTYSYDDAGRVLYQDGPLSGLGDAVYYRYDAAGRQIAVLFSSKDRKI